MIRNVAVHVLVPHYIARPDDERRPELLRSFPDLVLTLSRRGGPESAGHGPGSGELHPAPAAERCDLRGLTVFIEEDRKRYLLVVDEGARVAGVARADRNDLGTVLLDLLVMLTQLRSVVPTMQSPEVPQEDQHDWSLGPEIAEPVLLAVHVGEGQVG